VVPKSRDASEHLVIKLGEIKMKGGYTKTEISTEFSNQIGYHLDKYDISIRRAMVTSYLRHQYSSKDELKEEGKYLLNDSQIDIQILLRTYYEKKMENNNFLINNLNPESTGFSDEQIKKRKAEKEVNFYLFFFKLKKFRLLSICPTFL
jgi:hypothetical protein